jgi:16S rRNA (guanine966-N2)-methyltransferase
MRIIAGRFRGRRLPTVAGPGIRPTTDRVREALFSSIGSEVEGSDVLDLFAGTGAFGFEALSRGAHSVVFVERNSKASKIIESTVAALGVENHVHLMTSDVSMAIRRLNENNQCFAIIFIDPPYLSASIDPLIGSPEFVSIVSNGGLVILETEFTSKVSAAPHPFSETWQRRYGRTLIRIFRKADQAHNETHGDFVWEK